MRHWIGFGLAVVLAATLFFGAGWGITRLSALPAEGLTMTSIRGLSSLGAVAGAGLLLGILIAAPRVSPLAAGLPGLVLLAWTALFSVSGTLAVRLIPLRQDPSGAGLHAALMNGVAALLGFAMIFPLFVPSRWWQSESPEDGIKDGNTGQDTDGGEDGDGDGGEDGGGRQRRRRARHPPAPPGLLAP
jgi:hypothetical protein